MPPPIIRISAFEFLKSVEDYLITTLEGYEVSSGGRIETSRLVNFNKDSATLQFFETKPGAEEGELIGVIEMQCVPQKDAAAAFKGRLAYLPSKQQHAFLVLVKSQARQTVEAYNLMQKFLRFLEKAGAVRLPDEGSSVSTEDVGVVGAGQEIPQDEIAAILQQASQPSGKPSGYAPNKVEDVEQLRKSLGIRHEGGKGEEHDLSAAEVEALLGGAGGGGAAAGGNEDLSVSEIEAILSGGKPAAQGAPAEPAAPAPEPEASAEAAAAPTKPKWQRKPRPADDGPLEMSAAEFSKMLGIKSPLKTGEDKPAEAPPPAPKAGGGDMSPEEIEALVSGQAPAPASGPAEPPAAPAPAAAAPAADKGEDMSPDEIEALLKQSEEKSG